MINFEKLRVNNEETGVATKENTVTEVVSTADITSVSLVDKLKNCEQSFYCSIVNDGTRKSQIRIVNAMNNADIELKEKTGEVIEMVDICAYPVQVVSQETGEVIDALRTVIIDKDGYNYFATSQGVMNCLTKIFAIIGSPDGGAWHDEPVKVKVRRKSVKSGLGQVTTLELVE